jgi:hypothetical protein
MFQRRRVLKGALAAFSVLLLLVLGGGLLYCRVTFHTFYWWGPPPRITFCDRDFERGRTEDVAPTQGYTLTRVMTILPAGWAVSTKIPVNATPAPGTEGTPCTMDLVLEQDDHHFVEYGLLGGP